MNRLLRSTILSAALAATTLAALAPAEAHDRWHRHPNGGAVVAAGILGVAIGALAAGALSEPEPIYRPVYDQPIDEETPRSPLPRPRPVRPYNAQPIQYPGSVALEPWTPAWFSFCEDTYRTFDPGTGTFMGNDGQEHFCVAN